MATFYMRSRRPAEAEPYFQAAAKASKNPTQQLALAEYYLLMGRQDEGMKVLKEVAATPEGFVSARARIATVEYGRNRRAEAHAALDEALGKDPRNVLALMLKARFLLAEKQTDEALKRAQAAVAANPASADAQYTLAMVHLARKETDAATTALNETLRLNPRAAAAQMDLARLQLAAGRADTARQLTTDAVKNAPGAPTPGCSSHARSPLKGISRKPKSSSSPC